MKLTLTPWKEKSDHRPPLPSLRGGDAELGLVIHSSEMKAEVACGLPPIPPSGPVLFHHLTMMCLFVQLNQCSLSTYFVPGLQLLRVLKFSPEAEADTQTHR